MKKFILLSGVSLGLLSNPALSAQGILNLHPEKNIIKSERLILAHVNDNALNNAEKFVTRVADQGIGFLSNKTISQEKRKSKFQKLLKNNFDMKTIARFALGRYWKTATKTQRNEYFKLFENMILKVYANRFGEYQGEKLNVKGSRAEGKRDILVNSTVAPEKGPKVQVDWRVRLKNGRYKVIDVIVEGVSMSLTQRSDFSSVIQRGGGKVEVLLEHLREQ